MDQNSLIDNQDPGTEAALNVNLKFRQELEKRKAGLSRAALRISQAMDAKKVKYFAHEGIVQDSREDIDHTTRLTASKLVLDAYGVLANETIKQINIDQKNLNLIAGGEENKRSRQTIRVNTVDEIAQVLRILYQAGVLDFKD